MSNPIHDQTALDVATEIMALVNGPELPRGDTQLKAKIQCLVIDVLQAKCGKNSGTDSMRKDAERYRWLRDYHIGDDPESINLDRAKRKGLSAAIDAAMQANHE